MEVLDLHVNRFSGPIPSSLGNITSLTELYMDGNSFEGSIPPSLGNCQNLLQLYLRDNNLTGSIPQKLMELSTLSISLDLSENYLTGSLPSNVGDLVHLTVLNVSKNKLSGEIPSTIGRCTSLGALYLDDNTFEGAIPQSLRDLKGLEELDISSNNLSGQIPEFLGKLGALKYLNLSYNDFEGELPEEGIFSNVNGVSVLGNQRLCGGIPQLHLPACPKNKHYSSRGLLSPKVVIPISCALAFIIALSCFFSARSMLKKLNIAIDVAFALDYLHNHCETSIVHCDLKPSNVLLDEDMVARVGDFGLARFLLEASNDPSLSQTMSSQLKGSIGYIPPDVVDTSLLLDLEADGSVNDDRYERTALPRRNNRGMVKAKKVEECLFAVMHLGLSCCAVSPRERMLLNMVVGKMSAIRDSYLKVQEG
ncbi:LRR receptor-like serine/threonine-protein kinase [Pyrus ussuriensis x Pyrus communis]|uniref:LRR receptor-like serine/threonine-protein kinase n=1 Tax=Pyrus ussuriensis x Pyrus communis TaxID=2448454 RepID=A0A5N5HRQ1_9ROSA|nr:LRR receptor-like serine/threonine-protein kinase [Pyrus ussuriensis x Pyrus communis]